MYSWINNLHALMEGPSGPVPSLWPTLDSLKNTNRCRKCFSFSLSPPSPAGNSQIPQVHDVAEGIWMDVTQVFWHFDDSEINTAVEPLSAAVNRKLSQQRTESRRLHLHQIGQVWEGRRPDALQHQVLRDESVGDVGVGWTCVQNN